MKHLLALSLLASSLLAGLHETNHGLYLEIFEKHDPQSKIIAEVSTENGKIEQMKCRGTRNDEWCKVRYYNDDVRLQGWADKASLDAINARPNKNPNFEKVYGGRYAEEGHALIVLDDGYLLVGSSESFGAGQRDAYVVKVDKFGNKLWSETYGGGADDVLESVIPMAGGFMLAGSTWSMGADGQSLYVVRISNTGQLKWEHGYYSKKRDRYLGKSIVKVNDKNIMVAGSEEHIKFFNSSVSCYLTAVDIDGEQRWVERYGGKNPDRANSIIKVKDGYVFAGATESWGEGGRDMYVVKVDAGGNRLWHNAFGGDFDEEAKQVITTKDGGYLLVGTTNSDHGKLKDVYVVKIDAQGQRQWQRHYGGRSNEEGFGVVEDEKGYTVVGYTKSTKDLSSDVYLIKIDHKGATLWSRTYGGPANDEGHAIVSVEDGYVITGYKENGSGRGKDMYLIKVDKNGEFH